MKNRWIINVVVFGLLAAIIIYLLIPSREPSAADPAKSESHSITQPIDRPALEKLVHDEVEKQLPDAVAAEIQRQIGARQSSPQRIQPSEQARMNSLQSTLQTIRSELELYKIQHNDNWPAMQDMTNWAALTGRTDKQGVIGPNGEFGPYLMNGPVNPITGKNRIAPAGHADASAGWSFNEKTGAFRAVVPQANVTRGGLFDSDVEISK